MLGRVWGEEVTEDAIVEDVVKWCTLGWTVAEGIEGQELCGREVLREDRGNMRVSNKVLKVEGGVKFYTWE